MNRFFIALLLAVLASTTHADPIIIEAESFEGLSLDGASGWMLEYYPGASEGKQIQTGGRQPSKVTGRKPQVSIGGK